MAMGIYKSDQGYWTRMLSMIGAGILVLSGGMWLWSKLEGANFLANMKAENEAFNPLYVQAGVAGVIFLIGGIICYWLIYAKANTSEFLIATEGEMKKVNWSSRKEVLGSAWVVIAISVIIAAIIFVVDIGFSWLARQGGLLL